MKNTFYYLLALLGFVVAVAMVIWPENAYNAAVRGLDVWWNIVFPALLPFFIAAEILMGIGVVHFMGVLLEPLMRPLFRVPGAGSFVMAVGLASGFPIGSILTANLRRQNLCTKEEGERLMSFTNTADPLFMFGAVAVGMLAYPEIGYTIAAAHYLSSLSTGLIMRFHRLDIAAARPRQHNNKFILLRACSALVEARLKDSRPLGKLMGDAIRNSVNSLLLIGGFIISFSVLIELLHASGVMAAIAGLISVPAPALALLANGVLEITLGCQQVAQSTLAMDTKIVALGAIIAWSGLSVHGQVASIISDTDMSIKPFIFARVIHATLAGFYTLVLFRLGLVPALSAVVIDYSSLSLAARYWLMTTYMVKTLLVWSGLGLVSLAIAVALRAKFSGFSTYLRN